MVVKISPEILAMRLTHNKIEKKYKALGWSPWEEVYENYVGRKLTKEAQVDYEKHYEYFFNQIVSLASSVEEEEVIKLNNKTNE
jgi:hypothetical protein|tara:strand:+ start:3376 stop:3627 length:252 start_codon:yes stop_codon:yes gene_type:complete